MTAPSATDVCEGARVIITGLQAKPQHNGRAGIVCGDFDRDAGRWTVDLDAGDAGPAFRGSFRAANLLLVPSLSFSTQWLDEDGLVCPKNVDFLHQCPKGHTLVPLGNCCGEGDGDLPLLCRVCHCVASHNPAPNWMVCSTTASCCGGYAVCADCTLASNEAPAAAALTDNFPALVNAVRTHLSCKFSRLHCRASLCRISPGCALLCTHHCNASPRPSFAKCSCARSRVDTAAA